MLRGRGWLILLPLLLLTGFPAFAKLLTPDEIDSAIAADQLYPGSVVREFAKEIVTAADEEITRTGEEVAKKAAEHYEPIVAYWQTLAEKNSADALLYGNMAKWEGIALIAITVAVLITIASGHLPG